MCIRQRLSITAFRSIRFFLNVNPKNQYAIVRNITSKSSLAACRYGKTSLFCLPDYVMSNKSNDALVNKCASQTYSTDANQIAIPIVTYEEVKDLPNHPEKWLIDVREPTELTDTGVIPTAINIPRKSVAIFYCLVPSI